MLLLFCLSGGCKDPQYPLDLQLRLMMPTTWPVGLAPLPALEVSPEAAARALAFESRVLAALTRYGLRGGDDG